MSEQQEAILNARITRGADAARLLSDPLLKQALDSIERDIQIAVSRLAPSDHAGRDVFWRELGALSSVKSKLHAYVASGSEANKTLLNKITSAAKQIVRA